MVVPDRGLHRHACLVPDLRGGDLQQCALIALGDSVGGTTPERLILRLPHVFDWTNPRYAAALIRFDRSEYGGERDILLLPCRLETLNRHPAFLWTTTTPRQGAARYVVEIVADISLRDTFGLKDGDVLAVELELGSEA